MCLEGVVTEGDLENSRCSVAGESAINGMFVSTQNLHVEVLSPSVMVFGQGAFRR